MIYDDSDRLIYLLIKVMPRVVGDQRRKFETDESFLNLSRPCEVRYTGLPLGTDEERKTRFQQDCRDGRIEITCIPSGFNLEFYMPQSTLVNESETPDSSRDYIQIVSDQTKVQICSHFILNGVCVRWRGWIDSSTLRGQGSVEFDEERARTEDQKLQQELRTIEERLRLLGHHQPFLHNFSLPGAASSVGYNSALGPFGPSSSHATTRAMPNSAPIKLQRSSSSSSSSPADS